MGALKMNENAAAADTRLYYIDWLRVLVVLTLIPFHAALTYSGLGDTYIATPFHDIRVIPFILIVAPLGNFFMTLLFFVSGIASFHTIRSKGIGQYSSGRFRKLMVPLVLGTLFICPIQAYFKALYEGFSGSYFAFLPEFFSGKIVYYLGYAHLWFLLYLYVFSMLCLPLFSKWSKDHGHLKRVSAFLCRGNRILIPMAYILVAEVTLRPFFNGMQTLIGDWANDVVYLSMFIFGYVFASEAEIREKIGEYFRLSVFLAAACLAVFFYTYWMWTVEEADGMYLAILWMFAKGIYECAAIILLIGLGKKYLNKRSPALDYLNGSSFTYYLIHFVPVSLFTYVFIGTELNVYLRYLLTVVLSYIFIAAAYELFAKRSLKLLRAGR
jgi:peptidoglycan/LPS O-acetylase OafA/YrhL